MYENHKLWEQRGEELYERRSEIIFFHLSYLIGLSNGYKHLRLLVGSLAYARVIEKKHARELSINQSILRFDVTLQHDWPIEQCLQCFLWRKNEESMFWSFHPLADKTNNEHLSKPLIETKVIRKSLYVFWHTCNDAFASFKAKK